MAIQYLLDVTAIIPTYADVTKKNCMRFNLVSAKSEELFTEEMYNVNLTNLLKQLGTYDKILDVVTVNYSKPYLTDISVLASRLQEISYQTIERVLITGKIPQNWNTFPDNNQFNPYYEAYYY